MFIRLKFVVRPVVPVNFTDVAEETEGIPAGAAVVAVYLLKWCCFVRYSDLFVSYTVIGWC